MGQRSFGIQSLGFISARMLQQRTLGTWTRSSELSWRWSLEPASEKETIQEGFTGVNKCVFSCPFCGYFPATTASDLHPNDSLVFILRHNKAQIKTFYYDRANVTRPRLQFLCTVQENRRALMKASDREWRAASGMCVFADQRERERWHIRPEGKSLLECLASLPPIHPPAPPPLPSPPSSNHRGGPKDKRGGPSQSCSSFGAGPAAAPAL